MASVCVTVRTRVIYVYIYICKNLVGPNPFVAVQHRGIAASVYTRRRRGKVVLIDIRMRALA